MKAPLHDITSLVSTALVLGRCRYLTCVLQHWRHFVQIASIRSGLLSQQELAVSHPCIVVPFTEPTSLLFITHRDLLHTLSLTWATFPYIVSSIFCVYLED
ncbi:unnamed protein product [Protopolystoma xenopodis]|uniref:Uncharacterized protein n=1 Tax=Protopolystoma xenopodis TaxID=117903 RepID=A0A3S5BLC5_9PLAT|nr:unnamed protein product [Protopolystoma xenopodis]